MSSGSPPPEPDAALGTLSRVLGGHGRVVVAYSGGVDSALLARVAHDVLGPRAALAVTAVSPSLAAGERAAARVLAEREGLNWCEVTTHELDDPAYRRNDTDRCFWCKTALMDALEPLARARDAVVALGVNVDDLGRHRPGQQAAAARGAVFPLAEAGLTKSDVRRLAARLNLPVADKPASPCLASRLPYGTEVSLGRLRQVERAEAALAALGLRELRVRHHGELARVEVPPASLVEVAARAAAVADAVRSVGYRWATLDLDGLRSGGFDVAAGVDAGAGLRTSPPSPALPGTGRAPAR